MLLDVVLGSTGSKRGNDNKEACEREREKGEECERERERGVREKGEREKEKKRRERKEREWSQVFLFIASALHQRGQLWNAMGDSRP